MRYALTSARMRSAEERHVASGEGSVADLMARAGEEVALQALSLAPAGPVVVVTGRGNNGGDGFVAARRLLGAGREVTVVAPDGIPSHHPGRDAAESALAAGVRLREDPEDLGALLGRAALVVDAMFGIGFSGAPREPFASAIRDVNSSAVPVLAVDVPSGVDADTGAVRGEAVRAGHTVTFSAPKPGLLLYPGAAHAGEVRVAAVGLAERDLGGRGDLEVWDDDDYARLVPLPAPDAHKNRRGRVLVVAGSGAFPGAAILAVLGSQRSGAGYVTLATPDSAADVAEPVLPSAVVVRLPENASRTVASKAAEIVLDLAAEHDAVVIGPGLTLAHGAVLLVRTVVGKVARPLVLDADALNAMVDATGLLSARGRPSVLTPHPGELARLLGVGPADIQGDRLSYASKLAGDDTTCLLKGARSIIAGAGRLVVDTAGTAALAHAGTGDVLAGVVGTLVAQGLQGPEAAALAAHLHGWAGRLAGDEGSELAVIAEDVAASLPRALRRLVGR